MASEQAQKAGPNLRAGKKAQTWASALPLEKQKGDVGTWRGALQDQEKPYKLQISATEESKKHGAGISIEGLRKPQNP